MTSWLHLRFGTKPYKDFDLTLNVNLTPFKERFQDTLAGMTATLEIEIPFALNNCIAPTRGTEIVDYGFQAGLIVEPDPIGSTLGTTQPTYDPQDLWHLGTDPDRFYTAVYLKESAKQYRIEVTGTARALESKPIPLTPKLTGTIVNIEVPPTTGSTSN